MVWTWRAPSSAFESPASALAAVGVNGFATDCRTPPLVDGAPEKWSHESGAPPRSRRVAVPTAAAGYYRPCPWSPDSPANRSSARRHPRSAKTWRPISPTVGRSATVGYGRRDGSTITSLGDRDVALSPGVSLAASRVDELIRSPELSGNQRAACPHQECGRPAMPEESRQVRRPNYSPS